MSRAGFIVLFVVLVSCNSGGITSNGVHAEDYNNSIVGLQGMIYDNLSRLDKAIESNPQKAHKEREYLYIGAGNAVGIVRGMSAFNGHTAYKDAAIAFFEFYSSAAENEYKIIIDALLSDDIAEIERAFPVEDQLKIKQMEAEIKLRRAQIVFAQINKLTLYAQH